MNTKTEAQKIRKALRAQAFEPFNGSYGFRVETVKDDSHVLSVINRHYGEENEVASILEALGYEVSAPNKFATLIYAKKVAA
jgi:hypothetical protein